jgi:hypothetical protein
MVLGLFFYFKYEYTHLCGCLRKAGEISLWNILWSHYLLSPVFLQS